MHIFVTPFSGTPMATTYPCPLGTFGNGTGFDSSSKCTPCLGGMYCGIMGEDYPTGLCQAGFYCKIYAENATPNQTTLANVCPQGKGTVES